jgi:cytochrome c peroxidase
MHNGIFKQLSTAILFYNKYTVVSRQSQTNPETGAPWGEPEVPATIDFELLSEGQPIDQTRVQALIAFLETLTDRRYEALLK